MMTEVIALASSIPIRLSAVERKSFRLLTSALASCRYMEKVDLPTLKPEHRLHRRVEGIYSLLASVLLGDPETHEAGVRCIRDPAAYYEHLPYFQALFEAARRFKLQNPDRARSTYVSLCYLLMDAQQPEIAEALSFSLVVPVRTVLSDLRAVGAEALLDDPLLPHAITPVPAIAPRRELNKALRHKDLVVKHLLRVHGAGDVPRGALGVLGTGETRESVVERAIRSLDDANCHTRDNVAPIESTLRLLLEHFDSPGAGEDPARQLAIVEGADGARLSHAHAVQVKYVRQSLELWLHAARRMYALWAAVEGDVLDPAGVYVYRDVGQGHARVQPAPRVLRRLEEVLAAVEAAHVGGWHGDRKIHVGDDAVPNALFAVDKYAQVCRILTPLLRTLAAVEAAWATPEVPPPGGKADFQKQTMRRYIAAQWGTADELVLAILRDFFRHAFDGSGGDNDFIAGSCVDGRLTSAWNWCQELRAKRFYPVFLLAGFGAFDDDLAEH